MCENGDNARLFMCEGGDRALGNCGSNGFHVGVESNGFRGWLNNFLDSRWAKWTRKFNEHY